MFRSTLRRLSIIPDSDDSWETESEDGDAMPDLNDVDSTTEDESADTTGKKREIGNTSDLYPWFQPLANGTSPLFDSPDELLLSVMSHLVPPLFVEPSRGDLDDILSLSMTCRRLRCMALPFCFRSAAIRFRTQAQSRHRIPAAQAKCRDHIKFLYENPLAKPHLRALWIDVEEMPGVFDLPRKLEMLLLTIAPQLLMLTLTTLALTPVSLRAICSASHLQVLIMEDGFHGTKELARMLDSGELKLEEIKNFYASIDIVREASAVPLALVRGTKRMESLVVRGYHETFAAGWMPVDLWSSLRLLALDAGGVSNSGFTSLFQQFDEYCRDHHCPLEEVVIESRQPCNQEFQYIIHFLKSAPNLRKLSLMVLPRGSPDLLAFIATTLPSLTELNIVAIQSVFCLWEGTSAAYGQALASFPNLVSFGWNGLPGYHGLVRTGHQSISPTLRACFEPSKTLRYFTLFNDFGSTDYYGSHHDLGSRTAEGKLEIPGQDLGEAFTRPIYPKIFFPLADASMGIEGHAMYVQAHAQVAEEAGP